MSVKIKNEVLPRSFFTLHPWFMHGNKALALQRGYAITSHCLRPYCTAKLRYFIDMRKSIYRFFFLRFLWLFCDKSGFCIKTKLYVYGFVGLK